MFLSRNTRRAAKRGYAVAASAASLEVGFDNRAAAQTVVFRWGGDDSAREMETIERDAKSISVPRHRACHIEWRSWQEAAARQALGLEG